MRKGLRPPVLDRKVERRYNVSCVKTSGELADVSDVTVESWKERSCKLVEGCAAEDTWNLDETGLYGKPFQSIVCPERSFISWW